MNSLGRGNRRLGHGLRERIERPRAANAAKPHHHGALLSMARAVLAGGAGVTAIEASDRSNAQLRVLVRRYGSKPDASAMESDTHDLTLDSELIDANRCD